MNLPEAFSPDGTGTYDTKKPRFFDELEILSYSITVYDRWGKQLFVSEDPLLVWDGTYLQKPVNRGAYVYTIAIEYIDDRGPGSKLQRRRVLLLR